MTKEEYGKLAVAQLRERAKEAGIKGVSSMRKNDLIDALVQMQDRESASPGDMPDDPGRRQPRRQTPPRQDGHARVIVRRSSGQGQVSGPRTPDAKNSAPVRDA